MGSCVGIIVVATPIYQMTRSGAVGSEPNAVGVHVKRANKWVRG